MEQGNVWPQGSYSKLFTMSCIEGYFPEELSYSSGHLLLYNLWPIPPQIFGSTLQVSYDIITVSPIYLSLVNKHLFYCSCYVEQISSDPKQKQGKRKFVSDILARILQKKDKKDANVHPSDESTFWNQSLLDLDMQLKFSLVFYNPLQNEKYLII